MEGQCLMLSPFRVVWERLSKRTRKRRLQTRVCSAVNCQYLEYKNKRHIEKMLSSFGMEYFNRNKALQKDLKCIVDAVIIEL